jgi:hypothetical protein
VSQPSPEEWEAYRQLVQQGYKVDWTPEDFYRYVAEQRAKGIRPTFETYQDYLAWVKASPALQPGAWQPPPKLPEKPTIEDVKKALEEAKSTEQVMSIIEQAKKAGIPIEMSPAFYKEGVGRFVVAFGDVSSGKIVEMGFAFKGAGDQNILAKASQEVDISKEIEKAQQEGFQNIQLAIQKTFMACRPEDALRISLTGVKPPPPPPPPKHVIQVTNQPGVTQAATQLEVPSFEEFRKRPEVAKYPEDAQRQLYNLYLLKTAREKGYEYVLTPSGWERIPDFSNLRVDIASSLAQYANIPQVQVALWRMTEGKVYEQISSVEAAVRGFTAGLTSQLTFGLLSLGKLPEPPQLPAPRSFGTVIPSAVEVAPLPEKAKAMEALAPPPQLGVYKAGELAGMTAGIAFQEWLASKVVSTWKSIDIGEVLERYKAGESLTPLERLKLEAWIHTPEKVWKALSEATTVKVYEVPEEVELEAVRFKQGGEGLQGLAARTRIESWQEIDKQLAEHLKRMSEPVGGFPIDVGGKTVWAPWAEKGAEAGYLVPGKEIGRIIGRGEETLAWRLAKGLSLSEEVSAFAAKGLVKLESLEALLGGVPKTAEIELPGLGPAFKSLSLPVREVARAGRLPAALPAIALEEFNERVERFKEVILSQRRDIQPIVAQRVAQIVASREKELHDPIQVLNEIADRLDRTLSLGENLKIAEEVVHRYAPRFAAPQISEKQLEEAQVSEALERYKDLLALKPLGLTEEQEEELKALEEFLGPLAEKARREVEPLELPVKPPEFPVKLPEAKVPVREGERIWRSIFPPSIASIIEEKPRTLKSLWPSIDAAAEALKAAPALGTLAATAAIGAAAPPPSPLSTPTPEPRGGGRMPPLSLPSIPASSVIYRAPEWRLAKYWRVDWFKEGLKLDFRLGKLTKALAPKTVKVKQVDWLKPRAKPKPKRKDERARGKRKAGKRKRKRKVKAA